MGEKENSKMIKISIDYDPSIRGTRLWMVDEKPDGKLFAFLPTNLSLKEIELIAYNQGPGSFT